MAIYYESELYHHGIKGMKWGVRRYQNSDGSLTPAGKKRVKSGTTNAPYRSTGIRSAIARRQNAKVDASFNKWRDNSNKRADAIDLGKKANTAKRAYEENRSDKNLKRDYKQANREYKKALRENTTYRKGQIRSEVGKDASRKYLSDAKKVKKQLDADPNNKQLQKKYNELMSKHDIERANARRAPEVAAKRSREIANAKSTMTKTVKAAAVTAAATAGVVAYNEYSKKHGGQPITTQQVLSWAKTGKKILSYMY